LPRRASDLLPVICSIARHAFVFQQDNAPAHRVQETDCLSYMP